MRNNLIVTAVLFQAILIAAAQLIYYFAFGANIFENTIIGLSQVKNYFIGTFAGFGVFVLVYLLYLKLPSFRAWGQRQVMPMLKSFSTSELLIMGITAGIAEEILFRGALQPILGIFITSLLFGIVHYWFKKELLPYGIAAFCISILLGWSYEVSGNLIVPIAIHSVYNVSVILAIGRGLFD
ncbi:hypothetical protein GGQ84_001662 [Desulfitispora alkaliphila]|uniref:CPBP family intramembrane glutamic endopeptidase n=1 Tax=Desulfitispora alkaliphila TaxID=622674 RepID=UPI003D2438CE